MATVILSASVELASSSLRLGMSTLSPDLRYLEGIQALGTRIAAVARRTVTVEDVEYVRSCILHGRLFWESAEQAPLETKPLLLYYGAAAFAKALIVSLSIPKSQLVPSHGLTVRLSNGTVAGLEVRDVKKGLFQQFNDAVAPLHHVEYFEEGRRIRLSVPTAPSAAFAGSTFTLDDIVSRCSALDRTYALCSGKQPNCLPLHLRTVDRHYENRFELQADPQKIVASVDEARALVGWMRMTAPVLTSWRLVSIRRAFGGGGTIVTFDNVRPPAEISDEMRPEWFSFGGGLEFERPGASHDREPRFDSLHELQPLAGGFNRHSAAIAPWNGAHVSEFSWLLAGLLALSSLVRYHPDVWTACVHRRPLPKRPVDDQYLPLFEAFLAHAADAFPHLLTCVLMP